MNIFFCALLCWYFLIIIVYHVFSRSHFFLFSAVYGSDNDTTHSEALFLFLYCPLFIQNSDCVTSRFRFCYQVSGWTTPAQADLLGKARYSYSYKAWRLWLPGFLDDQHMKLVRFSVNPDTLSVRG